MRTMTMRILAAVGVLAMAATAMAVSAGPNEIVYAQAPVTVACTDTGLIAYNPDPMAVRWEVWNTSPANPVCVTFCGTDCTAQAPDQTNTSTCSFILGPYAGGTPTVWAVDAGLHGARDRRSASAFECDAAAASTLVVTEWRRQ